MRRSLNPSAIKLSAIKLSAIGLGAVMAVVAGAGISTALWSDSEGLAIPGAANGTVAFGAQGQADPITPGFAGFTDGYYPNGSYSQAGQPIEVRVPGSVIAAVLDQQETANPVPQMWSFQVVGRTVESLGLDYTVAANRQEWTALPDNSQPAPHLLTGGMADDDTVLYYTTLQVYPTPDGTCLPDHAPPLPTDLSETGGPHIYIYNDFYLPPPDPALAVAPPASLLQHHLLTEPGDLKLAEPTDIVTQTWCVAVAFINDADLPYTQQAWATGIDGAGKELMAFNSWSGLISFPPSLPMAGYYVSSFLAQGIGVDKSLSQDTYVWYAEVYPDPTDEPDVVISLDPSVTHIDPTVQQCADHFAYGTTPSNQQPCPTTNLAGD